MYDRVGAADKALAAIQLAVGVPLLQHLPTGSIRIVAFDDIRNERPNMLPVRILFGTIKDGNDKDFTVWILRQKDHTADRSAEQRFNIFDRLGKLRGAISAEEAVKQVVFLYRLTQSMC
jgi:hypothetical protein